MHYVPPYYKYVKHDDKLKNIVLTCNEEAPKSYATLTATSISPVGVTLDTSC